MLTTFSELCDKEVINCTDGARLGNVTDLELCISDCRVTAIIIRHCTSILKKSLEIKIPWEKIEKIGTDVIIVNYKPIFNSQCSTECAPHKKLFFK